MPAIQNRKTPRSLARLRSADSPEWRSAKDVFKTPKSPSPHRRVTRRSSIYQRKPAKTDISKMRPSGSVIVSPPGMKTRARRSSIYQARGASLLSPETLMRARRASMYVSSKPRPPSNEFSKVFHTPLKTKSPVNIISEQKQVSQEKNVSKKTPGTTKIKSPHVKKVVTPFKSPPIPTLRKRKVSEVLQTPSVDQENNVKRETPISNKSKLKSPAQAKKSTPAKTKKSSSVKKIKTDHFVTSTPAKSPDNVFSSKSMYATPGETPVLPNKDETILNMVKVSASKHKNAVVTPKLSGLKSTKKTPKSESLRKTPAQKRNQAVKKLLSAEKMSTPRNKTLRSAKKALKRNTTPKTEDLAKELSFQMSPVGERQAFQVIRSTNTQDTAEDSKSELPKPSKQEALDLTPKPVKSAMVSPKQVVDENDTSLMNNESVTSLGNETFSTDSRSARCIIL